MTKVLTAGEIPEVLYKYRAWSNPFHRKLIKDQELFLASPADFNDPFENIPIRWDLLTYEDCFQKNLEMLSVFHKGKTKSELHQIAKEATDSKNLWHPDKLKKESETAIHNWNQSIGILSLSENCMNILMWSHYSDLHKGFVVGLNTESLMDDGEFDFLKRVVYQHDYPIISGNDEMETRFQNKFFTKSEFWSYEDEWRFSKSQVKNRVVKLRSSTISSIVIGCQMSKQEEQELITYVLNCTGSHVRIYRALKSAEKFELELQLI